MATNMLNNFINVRHSLKNLSDEEFNRILPLLSDELQNYNFEYFYSEKKLKDDWKSLLKYTSQDNISSSTSRVGMKLCEHFFPNFFDIENKKGESFRKLWKGDLLKKVLVWNRNSHSTPYISELRRGLYFCGGLTKNTMFRPHLAKKIVSDFGAKTVFDPCAGWGGRMLGATAAGAHYTAFEPNKTTYENLLKLISFLNIGDKVNIINDVAESAENYNFGKFDMILTSPPYFDLEIYSRDSNQSMIKYNNYELWLNFWLLPLIKYCTDHLNIDGVSCWNVHNIGKMKLINDVQNIHNNLFFIKKEEYSLNSSVRQAVQNSNKNKKNSDLTICYKKPYKL